MTVSLPLYQHTDYFIIFQLQGNVYVNLGFPLRYYKPNPLIVEFHMSSGITLRLAL